MSAYIQLNRTLIRISGKDAEKFLQGQISIDVASLSEHKVCYSTLNDPKGRMYGLFKIIRREDDFLLSLDSSTAENAISQLSKYVVFFKCEITKNSEAVISGLALDGGSESQQDIDLPTETMSFIESNNQITIRLPSPHSHTLYEIWHFDKATAVFSNTEVDISNWNALETENGIPEIYEATQGAFILQDLNLDELGAVSFKKGCYTGQEIIARMKYLGKQKKKTYLLQSDQKLTISPKQSLYDANGKRSGTLVRSHNTNTGGTTALAVLNKLYAEENTLVYTDELAANAFSIHEIHYTQ